MSATHLAAHPDRSPNSNPEVMRAAFRELHGRRLHGFALLLTLGDRPAAARLASDALEAGATRVDELRHPERAAAWLRHRVVGRVRIGRAADADARVLLNLGVDEALVVAFGSLGRLERAALIASTVERLDRRDVASIVGREGSSLDPLLRRARERLMRAYAETAVEPPDGPIAAHVQGLARRAMG
jgi:DNA-directed RNA polymerase specialized sigma24 family protein